ncbi:PfkB family carbohydrate kinase [Streptomyces rutgersensis]|uniref:PfkB family carbohydrate kinase n=1 Tax=Streptomyces rutgersensis TaxID=53451 RepID=UPI0021562093|nr:PfkB family carbohydrate kinase [Streptomyces rutgersensis]
MRIPKAPAAGETVWVAVSTRERAAKAATRPSPAPAGRRSLSPDAVGNDDFGRRARQLWQHEGVAHQHVVTAGAPTMVGFILVEPSGENRIAIAPGALDELDAAAVASFRAEIASADILIVSMEIPEEAVLAALRAGRETGTRTLLNPAPARPLPQESWPLIDVLTPNQTEAPVLLGLDDGHGMSEEELARALQQRTAGTVVITRGAQGALIAGTHGVTQVDPHPAPAVVDTTGAGDSFTAAFAVALARATPLGAGVEFAAAAGSPTRCGSPASSPPCPPEPS